MRANAVKVVSDIPESTDVLLLTSKKNEIKMKKGIYLFFPALLLLFASCSVMTKTGRHENGKPRLSATEQKNFDYLFYEGIRLKGEGLYDQALENMKMCYQIDSLDAGLLSELGMLYNAANLNEQAVGFLEKALKYNPQNWWYHLQLISSYAQLKKIDDAIDVAEKLQKKYPVK